MLTINDLVTQYKDMPLNEDVIRLFGIVQPVEKDCMLRIADVQEILQIKTGSQVIKKLKARYGLNYNESVIPASVFAEHYGMKTNKVINFIKEKVVAGTTTKD